MSPWKQLPFEIIHSIDLLGAKEIILSFAQSCQRTPGHTNKCSLSFVLFENTRRIRQKYYFSLKKHTIVSKICVLNNLLGPRELILIFSAVNVRLLVDTSKSSLRFVTLDETRQNRPKFSLPWKDCFSFKNLCFQQPLRSQTNDPKVPTVIVKLAFGLL